MDEIWKRALALAEAGLEAVLVMVVDHRGSVPGKTGAKMVVTAGRTFGTVGGGIVERDVAAAARQGGPPRLVEVAHDGVSSGSVCSGRQVFALVPVDHRHEDTLRAVARSVDERTFGVFTATNAALSFEPGGTSAPTLSRRGDL
jgi:xanthine/CO dehydrogenase XdhC/CoxF family maturation factor